LNKYIYYLTDTHSSQKSKGIQYHKLEMWSVFLGYADDPKKRKLINEMIDRREALNMASSVLIEISKDEHERAKLRSQRKYENDLFTNIETSKEIARAG